MTLVDTSVWVSHFRATERHMAELLTTQRALIHPMIIGELACGNLRNRGEILENLRQLPNAVAADQDEVLELIEARDLWVKGIGWIDAHVDA
jgi:predicted nucleic acid-binding protein